MDEMKKNFESQFNEQQIQNEKQQSQDRQEYHEQIQVQNFFPEENHSSVSFN